MSSHREAPEISQDPAADNTDTYAFVSPDKPDTVTLITNYYPAEVPAGGPNFFEFGQDVLYAINIDNDGDGKADITYEFTFESAITNANTFLYNTGPISSLTDKNWSRRQSYTVTRVDYVEEKKGGKHPKTTETSKSTVLGKSLACPPCNIGPRSTPNYSKLAQEAIHALPGGLTVFAGQRNDPFFVDIGSIFDLGDLRPIQNLQLIPTMAAPGVDTLQDVNVHSIAIQIPISSLTSDGSVPTDVMSSIAVIGVWGASSRRKMVIKERKKHEHSEAGPWVQVSRLGCPLVNEVLIPMSRKDEWNSRQPDEDKDYATYVEHPELAGLLPVLYPKAFPNLEGLKAARADLVAIFLTGLPAGVVTGFQNNTGKVLADMLRLNVAVPPAKEPNVLGLVGGDVAGYPNGRRVTDDVTNISLRAVAGATYPLVEKNYKPDEAVGAITQGITPSPTRTQATFPYCSTPHAGFEFPSATE